MPQVSDRALILRRFAFGESSLVLQVMAREHGRVHLIAKGAYRPTARYFAALDLFDSLEISWSEVRGRELQTLQSARIVARRARLAADLRSYRPALSALELTGAAALEGRADGSLYELLELTLERLLVADVSPDLSLVVFELDFLHNLGLAPALGHCAACGRQAPPKRPTARAAGVRAGGARAAFSAGAGGRLCRACAAQARGSGRRVGTLPLDVLDFALAIQETARPDRVQMRELATRCDAEGLVRVQDFVARFLEYHLEARPRSFQGFLAAENRNALAAS